MFKKVHNINNPQKLIPEKKSLNGQTVKINTCKMQLFFQKEKTAKISTIKVDKYLPSPNFFNCHTLFILQYFHSIIKTPLFIWGLRVIAFSWINKKVK